MNREELRDAVRGPLAGHVPVLYLWERDIHAIDPGRVARAPLSDRQRELVSRCVDAGSISVASAVRGIRWAADITPGVTCRERRHGEPGCLRKSHSVCREGAVIGNNGPLRVPNATRVGRPRAGARSIFLLSFGAGARVQPGGGVGGLDNHLRGSAGGDKWDCGHGEEEECGPIGRGTERNGSLVAPRGRKCEFSTFHVPPTITPARTSDTAARDMLPASWPEIATKTATLYRAAIVPERLITLPSAHSPVPNSPTRLCVN